MMFVGDLGVRALAARPTKQAIIDKIAALAAETM
jgi:hypothetical protein